MASPTGISPKAIGLIAAGVLAAIFAAIIVSSVIFSTPQTQGQRPDVFPTDPSEIIDIEDTQSGGAMLVTIVDQNDPTRVSSTLRADRFEPIGEGRRRLDEPESWIYLKDGRAIRVNANFATMLMPDPNQAPESGTLEGDIVLRVYNQTPAPGQPADDNQLPTLTARFDQPVEFERRYLRLRSPGRFEIESEQLDFSGTDLTVILNDLRNRVELIDVMQGDQLVIHTDATRNNATPAPTAAQEQASVQPSTQPTSQPTSPTDPIETPADPSTQTELAGATDSADPPSTTPATPSIQRYFISLDREVQARVADSGSIQADTLELCAAEVDGQLPQDAIKQIAVAQQQRSEPEPAPTPATTTAVPTTATTASAPPPSSASPTDQPAPKSANDLVITWSGPMRVRPIDDTIPLQLIEDSLALRFNSDDDSGITMDAPQRRFTGQAKSATYFATRAIAELESSENERGRISMAVEETGTLTAQSLSADLSTGRIAMKQRGLITTLNPDPTQTASVRWKNSADIQFALDPDGSITQRLASARFEGAAIAEQDGNSIGARVINATLEPSLPPASALRTLELTEGVISSAENSMLSGSELIIDFVPSEDEQSPPEPVRVVSNGNAIGRTPDAMLRAQSMQATLMRDPGGQTRIRTANADGDVNYRDSKRTTATAQKLVADGVREIITLSGQDSAVTQAGSSITGNQIVLRAQRRAVEVVGPGTFDHDIALADDANAVPGQLGHFQARWSDAMRFDDTLGTINCEGSVKVISTPDALTRDTLSADRMIINLTPMPSADPVAQRDAPQRELISARASGRASPGVQPVPASIESRTYSPIDPELATGVLYLEGAQILADNRSQTLEVPGAGTLLILDRKAKDPNTPNPDSAVPSEEDRTLSGSGLTRFTWKSRMRLQRQLGEGTFTGDVVVDHKSLASNTLATLNTDTLTARFSTDTRLEDNQTQSAALPSGSNQLESATAQGNVRFLFQGRELLSDTAVYDAIEDSLFASAIDNKRVTLYDAAQPAPVSARTMRWDLSRDRIEINAPSPVRTTP